MAETPSPPRLLLPDVPALVAGQGRAVLLDSDGSIETLGHIGQVQMQPGDVFEVATPGGGGYGVVEGGCI